MAVLKVTSRIPNLTLIQCALGSSMDGELAFSYNVNTGMCEVVVEDINGIATCLPTSGGQYFKIQETSTSDTMRFGPDQCPVPLPSMNNELDFPYMGDNSRAIYRCSCLTDSPPVDYCPVVKCSGQPNITNSIGSCSVKDAFILLNMWTFDHEYVGGVTCTLSGIPCQRWDSQEPHSHSVFKGRSDLGNRCKIGDEDRPWCYTMDPDDRWDYCPVEELKCVDKTCGAPPVIPNPPSYSGNITIQRPFNGYQELAWYQCDSLTAPSPEQNCPVTVCDGSSWSEANISCSVNDCYQGSTYNGKVSCTQTGITCQRWDSDEYHNHPETMGRSDLHNWCRMTGENRPWCYTTVYNKRWDFCAVKPCP
ncbi:plasminogen-like [Argopecten irradians]|uniref:plasminogen-like n=1 Tax=Argopecten irradians TaxID=31199 RepID=UPI00372325DB